MQIEFQMTDDILIANLDGELDHHSSAVVREEIDKTVNAFHSKHLIFNFEKVTFMDSSGIGVIMGRYNKITQLEGRLVITGCNEYIDRILDMAGIYTIAARVGTVAESIEKIVSETNHEEAEGSEEQQE
jgi:stage II sporulation protein AA (anti-sigma F factor antagonist)